MFKRNITTKKRSNRDEDEEDGLLVFGYASRLYPVDERTECYTNEQHLIPWHGDENLKIDRYDGRLYLNDLSEFYEKNKNGESLEEICPTEQMEEEMCDEERYRDLYADIKKIEEAAEEDRLKRTKGAAIGFSYEDSTQKIESSSSEEEVDEPYELPEGLKLPVGLERPKSLKQSTIIDKTAMFVVKQGPQMEIVIKAKQRKNAEQFGFLEFDNILNPYYKYICKLIREQKYTPVFRPLKRRPKPKKLRRLAEEKARQEREALNGGEKKPKNALEAIASMHGTDSEEGTSDEEGGYLHPLLMGGGKAKLEDRASSASQMGPMPRPAKVKTPEPDLLSMIKRDYQLGKSNDVYSNLFKSLSDFLPKKEVPETKEVPPEEPEPATSTSADHCLIFETNEEAIRSYNEWHMSFYGRNSPFHPGPPPVVTPPPPSYLRAVQAAATYVAQHGPTSEQVLLDHNGGEIEFMLPTSRYYSFYQAQVRFHHWQVLKQVYEYQQKFESRNETQTPSPSRSDSAQPPDSGKKRRDRRRLDQNKTKVELEEPKVVDPTRNTASPHEEISKFLQDAETVPQTSMNPVESDMQNERKERARLFMEKILKDKLAAKNKSEVMGKEVKIEEKTERAYSEEHDDHSTKEYESATVIRESQKQPLMEKATVYKEIKQDTISNLINKTIEKALPSLTSMVPKEDEKKEEKRDKKEKKEKHSKKHHRRRSRSPSSDVHRDRDRKRRRQKSRSRSRSSESSHSSYRYSRSSRRRSTSRSRR
uniref:SURP motif domain-containing protein n=1 Tax=Acrobeloides nanus TaxID=290746 RepID=A0A914DXQ7_9BILA